MSAGAPTIPQVRVANVVMTAVSVVVTCLRLIDRTRTHRFWWDDGWAALTMVFMAVFMASVEVHLQDPAMHSRGVRIAAYYLAAQFFYAVVWSARISILFTVIRLSVGRLRQIMIYIAAVFFLTWAILFSQVWWVCESNTQWKNAPIPQCDLGLNVAVAQVITDVLCDLILIVAPFHLVWRIRLSRAQKIRVLSVFSTTIISTSVSMYHAYAVLRKGGLPEALAAIIQTSVSLIVASLSVIIAFFFRISTDSDTSAPRTRSAEASRSYRFGNSPRVHVTHTTFVERDGTPIEDFDEEVGVDIIKLHNVNLPSPSDDGRSDKMKESDPSGLVYEGHIGENELKFNPSL